MLTLLARGPPFAVSEVFRSQILTYKDDPRTERIKYISNVRRPIT